MLTAFALIGSRWAFVRVFFENALRFFSPLSNFVLV